MGRWLIAALLLGSVAAAQSTPPDDVTPFISVKAPVVVLNHVRVIDGTGSPAAENQTIVIADGKIQAIGNFGAVTIPSNAEQQDRTGYTVIPGLVGMHNHLYYTNSYSVQLAKGDIDEPGVAIIELPYSAPRLYLAAGVTTMRTTGSIEPYTDIKVKQRIDAGLMPGPKIDLTAPYLEGKPTFFAQMHELTGVDDAKRMVNYWADEGMTSYKAYMNITRDELGAAIQEAHARHMKLTGHLCSVTWHEAIALGIDDFEHGPVFTDTEFVGDKKVDECAPRSSKSWMGMDVGGAQVKAPPIQGTGLPSRGSHIDAAGIRSRHAGTSQAAAESSGRSGVGVCTKLPHRARAGAHGHAPHRIVQEGAGVRAGVCEGRRTARWLAPIPPAMAVCFPDSATSAKIELLVETGFTPVEAIKDSNHEWRCLPGPAGPHRLDCRRQTSRLGALIKVRIRRRRSRTSRTWRRCSDIVGVGYDSQKLIGSVRGQVGIR